jgi:hypothetical protein
MTGLVALAGVGQRDMLCDDWWCHAWIFLSAPDLVDLLLSEGAPWKGTAMAVLVAQGAFERRVLTALNGAVRQPVSLGTTVAFGGSLALSGRMAKLLAIEAL